MATYHRAGSLLFTAELVASCSDFYLQHIANPRVDITESMKKVQTQRSKRGATIKGRRSTPSSSEEHLLRIIRVTIFHDLECQPPDLRKSPVFEVFLNHMFPVSDCTQQCVEHVCVFFERRCM